MLVQSALEMIVEKALWALLLFHGYLHSYSLECGGTPHCTMGSLITQLIDNAAQIPLDSKLKQALQRAQKEQIENEGHEKKLWCKAQFRAQNALTFLLVTIFTNDQNVHYIHFKWSKFSHPKHTVK